MTGEIKKEETVQGLLIRAAGHGIKFRVPFETIPLKVLWPHEIDDKLKSEFVVTIKKNKEELKRVVIIRDLPRHPIKPEDIIPEAIAIFGGKEVPAEAQDASNGEDGDGNAEIPQVPY